MKTKIISVFSIALLLSVAAFSIAKAEGIGSINVNAKADVRLETEDNGNATSAAARATVRGSATGTEERNENATNTDEDNKGELTSSEHRSVVATFVQSLLAIADREGGIGAEVREVAKSQNDSASTTADATVKVEERGSVRTFFFGSDYKNLGVIRSELATTSNNIARLKLLLNKTTNVADRAELNVQIQTLEALQTQVDAYVIAHENTWSIFGWLTKLFAK